MKLIRERWMDAMSEMFKGKGILDEDMRLT